MPKLTNKKKLNEWLEIWVVVVTTPRQFFIVRNLPTWSAWMLTSLFLIDSLKYPQPLNDNAQNLLSVAKVFCVNVPPKYQLFWAWYA